MGLIARQLEAAGVPTITLSSAMSITASVNPPRAAFADLPLGHTAGGPGDPEGQRHLVRGALEAALAMTEPGSTVDLGVRWTDDDWKAQPLGWRRPRAGAATTDRRATANARAGDGTAPADTRRPRHPDPQYQNEEDRLAAEQRPWDEQCQVCLGLEPPG